MASLVNSDVIAISSAFIALLALVATIWQARISREHNRLSVRPMFHHVDERFWGEYVTLGIENAGLGPGMIDEIVFIDTETGSKLKPREFVDSLALALTHTKGHYEESHLVGDTAFVPGEQWSIVKFTMVSEEDADFEALSEIFDRTEILLKYRCLYGCRYEYRTHLRAA